MSEETALLGHCEEQSDEAISSLTAKARRPQRTDLSSPRKTRNIRKHVIKDPKKSFVYFVVKSSLSSFVVNIKSDLLGGTVMTEALSNPSKDAHIAACGALFIGEL